MPTSVAVDDFGNVYFTEGTSCVGGSVEPGAGKCIGGQVVEGSYPGGGRTIGGYF